jgi:hypothetical protein
MERLLTVTAGLALLAVLFAGCGGGGADHAKVEASLRDYLDTVRPDETGLPLGLGVPRVRRDACKDGHVKVPKGKLVSAPGGLWSARSPEETELWSCVVTVGSLAQPTTVAVTGSTKVVWALGLPLDALVPETATYAGITCNWPRLGPSVSSLSTRDSNGLRGRRR